MATSLIIKQLNNSKAASRIDVFTEYIRISLAEFLELDDKNEIAIDQDFVALGVSSMEAVNFKIQLENELECSLKTTLFFDYPTLDVLVKYIVKDILKFEIEAPEIETKSTQEKENRSTVLKKDTEPIVIIAMDCMFPDAMTPNELWEQSIIGQSVDKEMASKSFLYNKLPAIAYQKELLSLGITEEAFLNMSKQQKIAYTTINNAICEYKVSVNELTVSKTGVFFVSDGVTEDLSTNTPYQIPLSNEISFELNLNGPSETINTFCTSIYVAMHRAIQSIQAQECEQAIVGGVNTVSKKTFQRLTNQGIYNDLLSIDNKMLSFSDQANGFVRSEGAGAIIVTTLSKALKNNAQILALVKGTTVGHGGRNFSIEAPKATGIKNTIKSCIQKSDIAVATIDYIEAHGIANPLADAVELSSLHDSYTSLCDQQDKKWHISTVKPVVGHPELVSGVASLIKVIKAFEYEMIPGVRNLQTINTEIPSDNNLSIQKETIPWVKTSYPKRVGLNSYAIGGVNAHMILEKYNDAAIDKQTQSQENNIKNSDDVVIRSEKRNTTIIANTLLEVFDLELEKIDVSLSPMEYGFDSIKMIQFIRRINEKFAIDIKIGEALGVNSFEDFFQLIATKKQVSSSTLEITPVELNVSHDFSHEASLFQKGLWLTHELDPLSSTYNLPIIFLVKKEIRSNIVLQAMTFLLEKHPVLRVYFQNEKEQIVQRIHPISYCLNIDEDIFTTTPEEAFKKLTRRPFDLQKDCLLRVYKRVDKNNEQQFLVFVIHHTILDGLSGTLFMKLFWETYHTIEKGEKKNLEKVNTHFFDFVTWEHQYMKSSQANIDVSWWKKQLANISPILLPYDHTKNIAVPYQDKDIVTTQIKGVALQKLKETATRMKVSLSVLLMAGFKILLHKLTLQEDITIATPTEGRQKTIYEDSLGCFVNVILMRSQLDTQKTIAQNVLSVKENFLSSLDHAAYPLTGLLAELSEEQERSKEFNIAVSYTYQNIFDTILDTTLLGDTITPVYDVYQETQDEYAMEVYDFRDTLQLNFKYKKLLFEKQTIEKHLQYFIRIIDQIITNEKLLLGEVEILSKEEKATFFTDFDKTNIGYPKEKTLVDLFEEQVVHVPDHSALTYIDQQISYQELNIKANQFANYLRRKGVAQKDKVILCIDRSIDMIVSILAVAKTGATYVPIDPLYPIERIKYSIDDAKPKAIVCTAVLSEILKEIDAKPVIINNVEGKEIAKEASENLDLTIHPEDALYVIYTSGTTGYPKGVVITHNNVVRLLKTDQALFDFNKKDVWTLFHSYCFDFSVWEMYGALLFGGRLVIVPDHIRKDTVLFYQLLVSQGVTILNQTPSSFYALQDQIGIHPEKLNVRYVIFGGEALQPALLKQWHTTYPNCKLINMYGITETTVHVTYQEITATEINEAVSTIGVPIPTLSCYVLDKNMNLLPNGVAGELYVGGEGVAKEYLNRPELTKERFVRNPFNRNTRLYKTGDIVKYNYKNQLEYIGRIDEQVKVRGYRIELAEIENVLLKNPTILQCVVAIKEISKDNQQIIAYIKQKEAIDEKLIFEFLESQIPSYMIPNTICLIDDFVLTSNGKIDKEKLPLPDFTEIEQNYIAPTNDIEKEIVTIFEEILEVKKVGILDHFFELGGHSLLVMKTIHKINTIVHSKLAAKDLFKFPTPQELAVCINNGSNIDQAVNLQEEIQFDPTIHFPLTKFVFPTTPQHIFVTGGTGFVGAFLLRELLENTNAQLYCLTRANSKEKAFLKIKNVMITYDLWLDAYTTRIQSMVGDIGAPLLGLSPETFDKLCTTIDVIYHNAAHMNHMATYQDLKPANVEGTLEIIKLASKHKIKPLHYTSTLAVFNNTVRKEIQTITEKHTSENEIHYESDGYPTSKWVGENVILKAQKAGLPCVIYRLGLTIGDTIKGRLDDKQWFYGFMKSCVSLGAMINQDLDIELPMMPVDIVAKSLVYLSLKKNTLNQTFHLVGKPSSLHTIFKKYSVSNDGVSLKELSMYDWLQLIKLNPELPVPPFMLEYLELDKEELITRKNKELTAKLEFDTTFTEREIEESNILFPNIDSEIVLKYFDYVKEKENLVRDIITQ
ncbi:non-ribosomal peptide synthetase [Aquimarina aquimarini]|uniref:non-ribosomal peptide synthetase n=1 Tax=Aquimarina aquimarini TaxID=1191734 RepID=UPI000D55B256|nr:non-ribosomal peptide synthetase [Aquimarina aquimarini]